MQVHENKEKQSVSLAKGSEPALSLFHTRYIKNNKKKLSSQPSLYIQDMKYVQHKNVNMSWYYWKFPMHPFADEKYQSEGKK